MHRTCTLEECDRPHSARGYCKRHYNQHLDTNRHRKRETSCFVCGRTVLKEPSNTRTQVCSYECRKRLQFGWSEPLPEDHWALWFGRTSQIVARACIDCDQPFVSRHLNTLKCEACRATRTRRTARFTSGQCFECGKWFTAETYGSPIAYCSQTCARRVGRRSRRAREHDAPGDFRFVELLRIYAQFDHRCAYCELPIQGMPDPEHVIPLSRGGRNDIGNLLPACRPCNADKQDMTPKEWALWRQHRGKPPMRTSFPFTDTRFRHLRLTEPRGLPQHPVLAA